MTDTHRLFGTKKRQVFFHLGDYFLYRNHVTLMEFTMTKRLIAICRFFILHSFQFFIMPVSPPRFTALRLTALRSRPFESRHERLRVSMLPMSPLYMRSVLCT